MVHLHDMHCHIDLYSDYQELIEECEREGIYTLAVTNTPSVFRMCADLTQGRHYIRPAVGLHPELAFQREQELSLITDLLQETRYVGEVGLDFTTTDAANRRVQQHVFSSILEAAAAFDDRVITVHSRRAAKEVVAMIGPQFPGTIILHWYSGPLNILAQAVQHGYYFSVNPAMTASAAGRKIIQHIPHDRILLETDGPFIALHGHPARPRDLSQVISRLAEFWQEDRTKVQVQLKQNLSTALKKHSPELTHTTPGS